MSVQADQAKASTHDLDALFREALGSSASEDGVDNPDEWDQFDAYALIRMVAEECPLAARNAVREGIRAHYRGDAPFDYPLKEIRERRGEETK